MNKIADNDLFDWVGRAKIIDCICNSILVDPQTRQVSPSKILIRKDLKEITFPFCLVSI